MNVGNGTMTIPLPTFHFAGKALPHLGKGFSAS